MKRIINIILLLLIMMIPTSVFALRNDYVDLTYKITQTKLDENKVNLYLFHNESCPHCKEEIEFLGSIKDKYNDYANFYYFELSNSETNTSYYKQIKSSLNIQKDLVPLLVIGDKHHIGFNASTEKLIEQEIKYYAELSDEDVNEDEKAFTLFGHEFKFKASTVSIPILAIVFGLIDGFNPCAMWVLLFLINMFIGMNNKKRMFTLGFAFLFTSGLIYFLSMLGINVLFGFISTVWLQRLIAVVALTAGILNIRTYIKTRKDDGCHVIDKKKRKSIFSKTDKIIHQEKFVLAFGGIILLAVSVNLVELACTAIFPAMFDSVLALNNIKGIMRIIYLIIYVLCYMLDDIVIFTIAMKTLSVKGISTKYNKYVHLVSGIIMIIMALLLVFKPEWIQLAF